MKQYEIILVDPKLPIFLLLSMAHMKTHRQLVAWNGNYRVFCVFRMLLCKHSKIVRIFREQESTERSLAEGHPNWTRVNNNV